MKVIIRRKLINEFRKQCRKAYPNETVGILRGVRRLNEVEILFIDSIPHAGTTSHVTYDTYRSKISAARKGTDWLGTIHSHCDSDLMETCGHPSDTDHKEGVKHGETVMGIVYVVKGDRMRTDVNWFVPAVPPVVELKGEE